MLKLTRITLIFLIGMVSLGCVYQRPDMSADMTVGNPRYALQDHPVVVFDAGHGNFHAISSTYRPFARLLENDGLVLEEYSGSFSEQILSGIDLLIIANATTPENGPDGQSAFSLAEIEVLRKWVLGGGSLLLIADHEPFGAAAADLAKAFSVGMQNAWTVDALRMSPDIGKTTWLEYTRQNGGLGNHTILRSAPTGAAIQKIITFTGQSLEFDSSWTAILQLSDQARSYHTREAAVTALEDASSFVSAAGQGQLVAREYGAGRIVIAGEAAMFTAQEARIFFKTVRAGFNYAEYDNKQLVLNIVHWLLGDLG